MQLFLRLLCARGACLLPVWLQAAWIEAEKEAAKRSEQRMAELAAREAHLNAQADALAAQQQVRHRQTAVWVIHTTLSCWWHGSAGCTSMFNSPPNNLIMLYISVG
jgi:hypothetical protein